MIFMELQSLKNKIICFLKYVQSRETHNQAWKTYPVLAKTKSNIV